MERESFEEKQKYIKENILEKGYDPDIFMEFLLNKKKEMSLNLNNWTMLEIRDATNEFLQLYPVPFENNTKIKKDKENDNFNIIIDEKEEILPQEKYVSCGLIEETLISKENKIEIKVSEPQIEKGGIFSFSYSSYLIKTSPVSLEVRRRYTDFIWLYNILKKHFVNCIIPPLFKKKDKLIKEKMEKKIYFLEKFLNDISIHPLLRNSNIFYDFISIKNEKEFIEKKNKYEKTEAPSNIKKIKTLNGETKVSISYDNEQYFQNIKEKLSAEENIFDKLISNYKILLNNIQQTSTKINDISKILGELYNHKNIYFESECTSGSYSSLIKVMIEWSEFQNKNIELIRKSIINFIKYIKQEFSSFKDLYNTVENDKNYYYKKKQKLLEAKEALFSRIEKLDNKEGESEIENEKKKEIEFSKLMISDIEKLNEIEEEYGCYLNCYISEYERLRDLNSIRMKKGVFQYVKDFGFIISNLNFSLGEILSYIDSLTEEGYIGNGNININNEIYNNAVPVAGKDI